MIVIYLTIIFIFFLKLKAKNKNRIIKLFKFVFKLCLFPIKLIFNCLGFFLKEYLRNRKIKNKELEKEKLKKLKIENKIKNIKENITTSPST